ncbi:neurofilament heavy polypeptide isoform X1 [Halyomorpha halys]|uniref:neurofilament heavy polypeptide isoform X1 n=2 Tax=Halyomorpha halys TaxID=286706 RepID=UPI0006D4DBB2|nr:muscle M-line assembly protein unc-89 isoform X1 [Halyomorpha halys]XP_014273342.1 muscle M-line assembly protein unc-89 isoform X1 [Halyomorpha halys]
MDKKESQQKTKKGAAPFASVEDLSDDSPEDRAKLEVPGARGGVTPRIDISRASSSSHHEDSSPERELFGGEGGGVKVGLGFTEDMALELRSSTEELDFHEPEPERKSKRKKLQQQQAVVVTKYDLETEYEKEIRERKDSGCSEGGLLFIGGRTSRLSSIGSAASGGSGVSAGSAVSHLSAVSNLSRASRCSSPHKMLLETSFCGPKPIPTLSLEAEYPPSESVEAALLKRKADPTGAILPNCLEVRDNKPRRCSSERAVRPQVPVQAARSSSARAPKRPNVSKKSDDNELFKIIPLHGSLEDDDDDSVDNPVEDFQPENGIYIPLKGPIIDCRKQEEEPKRKKPEMEDSELFKFISLHGDDEEVQNKKNNQSVQFKSWEEAAKWVDLTKPRSPEPPKPGRLELEKKKNGRSLGQIPRDDSRTPSPASSFSRGNIFRRSSDSSGSSKKSCGSGDSKSKKDSRNKSMFTALFRKNVKEVPSRKSNYQDKAPIDPKLTNVEYKFKQDEHVIDKDTIIIPLHSPDEVVEPLIRYDPTKDDSDILKDIRPEIRPESSVPDNQRSSLNEPTIEKNIVVVDVINEDTKEPIKNKLSTQDKQEDLIKSEMKELIKSDVSEQTKSESKASSTEIKKSIKELTKKVEGLEIQHLECEPRVRRSSSVSSREVEYSKEQKESIIKPEEGNVNLAENQESLKNETQESDETVRQSSQETVIENPTAKEEVLVNEISPNQEDVVLSNIIQDEEIESLIKKEEDSENNLTKSEGNERQSSESEVDMEVEREVEAEECDEERKGLFHQTDSQEDELPYVPTTLPQERSVAVPIIPIRQRVSEVKTCPVERPRSTTPIQPSNLEEYATFHEPRPSLTQEKMQITLPRTDSFGKGRGRGKASSPPPLPPRAPQWVAFDEPERRRPPRRITTLPYTYVNPEECTCECHEAQHRSTKDSQCSKPEQCSYPKKGSRTEKEKRYRT